MKFFSKRMLGMALAALLAVFSVSGAVAEGQTAYGADAVQAGQTYTVEQMLTSALEDEYLAQAQYTKAQQLFGQTRVFAQLLRAEKTHIARLTALMQAKGVTVPSDTSAELVSVPASLDEALTAAVAAEQKNIAMYDVFLGQQGLTDDVKAVFTSLKKASQSHLNALNRNISQSGSAAQSDSAAQAGGQADATASATAKGNAQQSAGSVDGNTGSTAGADSRMPMMGGRGMRRRDAVPAQGQSGTQDSTQSGTQSGTQDSAQSGTQDSAQSGTTPDAASGATPASGTQGQYGQMGPGQMGPGQMGPGSQMVPGQMGPGWQYGPNCPMNGQMNPGMGPGRNGMNGGRFRP